ncbi:hypothetical protein JOD31_002028 [Methylopila capsulata]|uniref:Polysaccharide pyruvyl transferase domain-containing protein n=1 Tax=Methylopila capsulata TaxID=61654 RepID=A0A9W6MR23_9HYPH|nr:polysaccharide pyruvyl transferase family protein [Methylopila capsulata]MBM7851803.1 hypothetical protein [Methylopila capsulata]GLK54867.1 hypothetical protein GCM10008170_08860 [Methylopila capsulata]
MARARSLVVRGYYGNGNCGDEALLATLLQYFSPAYKFIVSVNDAGRVAANLKKKKIGVYADVKVVWSLDRGVVTRRDVAGFLLGGGGLGLGFGWDQYMFAWRKGKKIIHTGVHVTEEYVSPTPDAFNDVTRALLGSAHFFSVRHRLSVETAARLGVRAAYVPDWAFALHAEPGPTPARDYVVVTIRADAHQRNPHTLRCLQSIAAFAEAEGLDVVLLPFDISDQRLTRRLKVAGQMLGGLFYRPAYVKHLIAHAKVAFSLGRYHPIVFAMASDVPVFSVDAVRRGRSDDKTCLQLVEEGLDDFHFPIDRLDAFTPAEISRLVRRYAVSGTYSKSFMNNAALVDAAAGRIHEILKS